MYAVIVSSLTIQLSYCEARLTDGLSVRLLLAVQFRDMEEVACVMLKA